MITPDVAMWILVGFAVLLLIVIPLLDSTDKFSKIISMRWTCTAVILILMVAVIVDFEHLSDETRNLILKGGLVVVGAFILLRSIEKVISNGWLKGFNIRGSIEKGGVKATVDLSNKNLEATVDKKDDSEKEDSPEIPEENNMWTIYGLVYKLLLKYI